MNYVIPLMFLLVYISKIPLGYSDTSPLYTHFTYMLQHASLIHLTLNTISFLSFFAILKKVINPCLLTAYAYTAALIASFLSIHPKPTVGASGMIYALIAIYITLTLKGKKMALTDKRKYILWLIFLILSTAITALSPNINNLNHLSAFLIGIIFGIIENHRK